MTDRNDGDPPMIDNETDADFDDSMSMIASDVSQYFELLGEQERQRETQIQEKQQKAKAPHLRLVPHTDTELVPMSPVDILYEKLVFDPEAELKKAAFESWILDDLIPSKGVGFIYGPPGSYKSFIALDMGLCVSSGRPWHGYECELPGATVYIAAEGARGILERAVAWKLHHECELGPFVVMPVPVMFDEALMVQAFIDCVQRAVEQLGQPVRMLVIDTMARSFNGDENSAQEVGAFVNSCERVASELDDCFVLVVAHTGKDTTRGIRGSSALNGAAYCSFLVTKIGVGQALVKNDKQKDVELADPMRFAMQSVSTGIVDRKDRIRRSLVPVLESKGEYADPDAEEVTAFDHRDSNVMCGMVRGAERDGVKLTEDELRREFIAYLVSDGKKEDAAKKGWQRTFKRVRESGMIMKAGTFLYPGDGK